LYPDHGSDHAQSRLFRSHIARRKIRIHRKIFLHSFVIDMDATKINAPKVTPSRALIFNDAFKHVHRRQQTHLQRTALSYVMLYFELTTQNIQNATLKT